MPAFNSRIMPKKIAGRPAGLFYYGIPATVLSAMAIMPFFLIRLVAIPSAFFLFAMAAYTTYHHKDALLLNAKRMSKAESKCYTLTPRRF